MMWWHGLPFMAAFSIGIWLYRRATRDDLSTRRQMERCLMKAERFKQRIDADRRRPTESSYVKGLSSATQTHGDKA